MNEYQVSDYGIFQNAVQDVKTINTNIDSSNTSIAECKEKLSDQTIFMGPVADECTNSFQNIAAKFVTLTDQMNQIENYLIETAKNYQAGDTTASSLVSSVGSPSSVTTTGSTQASALYAIGEKAYNGDAAAQQEWINQMKEIADPICKQYGFPTSVLLAQIIQESGWTKSSSWLNQKNNVLNVNYEMFGSGDYKKAKDGTVNENAHIPNWASYRTYESGTVSAGADGSGRRVDPMRTYNSMEDCIEDYLGLMVGYRPYLNGADANTAIDGIKGYAEGVSYASSLHKIVDKYNLTQYDT